MTDAEKAAYTLTRQRIVSQIDKIIDKGGSPNDLKRLKRFGSAFSWYPEFYPQILADINGMSDKELMSALRTEDKFMKLMAPVKGLPIHHKVANRTGGDIALRTPTDVFLDVRQMFYDKYGGFPGNSPWNLGAQGAIDERMHQGRYGAKGTVFDPERGYGMAPTPELPTAHGPGTKNIGLKLGQDPALLRSQAEEIFKSLDVYVGPQLEVFRQIEESPVTIAQRKIIQEGIDPEAFAMGRTPEQSTAVRKAAEATGLDVQFAKAFQYDFKGGKAVLKMLPVVGTAATIGLGALDVAQSAEGISSVQQATSTPEAVAGGLEAVSGGLGLAATKVPVLAAPAMVAGVTAGAIRMRMERDVQREREQQVMAGEVSRYGPAVTETPQITKPMSTYQQRKRYRTGRYTAP